MEKKIKMISAASQALGFKKKHSGLANEDILKQISQNIFSEFSEKNQDIKIGMIAAASKALDIAEKNPKLTEKEVINQVMKELSGILDNIEKYEK